MLIGKSKNLEREVEVLENNELISSISKAHDLFYTQYMEIILYFLIL